MALQETSTLSYSEYRARRRRLHTPELSDLRPELPENLEVHRQAGLLVRKVLTHGDGDAGVA